MFKTRRSECGHCPRRMPPTAFHALSPYRYNAALKFGAVTIMQEINTPFSEAFGKAVDLGNRIADTDDKADIWDIADGLLAGAVQYWLYSRQPCTDPNCEECIPIGTAEGRLEELRKLLRQFAQESEYFHSPTDRNVGRA